MDFSKAKAAALIAAMLGSASLLASEPMTGAGSSAAYPIYKVWAEQFKRDGGDSLDYDPVGSAAGLEKVRSRQVDFGATDVPLKSEQLVRDKLVIFPTVITGVVPVVNLSKLDKALVLDGATLAGIFLGKITRWDAQEIRNLNPGLNLPARPIVPVVRADGSGTTYNFADYLAKVSPAWKQKMGVAASLKWPDGFTAADGSKGVAEAVQGTAGAIGYVDYSYVPESRLTAVSLKNADGMTIEAGPATFHDALMQGPWMESGDFTLSLTNQAGRRSWPITMAIYGVLPRVTERPERTARVTKFFTDAFMHGDELAIKAHFVRLPALIQSKAFRAMSEIVDTKGRPVAVTSLK